MRRNSFLCLVILLSGCKSQPEAVWVDLDGILASESTPATSQLADPPSPPKPSGPISRDLPTLTEKTLEDPSMSGDLNVQASAAESQRKALEALRKQLQIVYAREARRFELEQRRLLEKKSRLANEPLLAELRAQFESYAAEREPKFTRLAFLAGFPDRNPDSKPPTTELTPVRKKRFEESASLRLALKSIDAAFAKRVAKLLEEAKLLSDKERDDFERQIADYAQQMNERAMREAIGPTGRHEHEVKLELAESHPIKLPAVPGKTVTLPAEKALPAAPKVDSRSVSLPPQIRRQLLEKQLRVWLATQNKVLTSKRGEGKDVTKDFQAWRSERAVGL